MPADENGPVGVAAQREPLVAGGVHRLFGAGLGDLAAKPLARLLPCVRPGDPLRPVLVAGQLLELAELRDGPGRLQGHCATLTREVRVW